MITWFALLSAAFAVCDDLLPPPQDVHDPEELVVAGYRLEALEYDGADLVAHYRLLLHNTDDATFGDVQATLSPPPRGVLEDGIVTFTRIEPGETVASDDAFRFRFPAANLEQARRWFRSGAPVWETLAYEIPTLAAHVRLIDAETDANFSHESVTPDGRVVHWFDALTPTLAEVEPGTVLYPTPDLPGWTGVSVPEAPQLPLQEAWCSRDFPLQVEALWEGDGSNGGDPGQIGLVAASTRPTVDETVRSVRVDGSFASAYDSGSDGPADTWLDLNDELARDGRACPVGEPRDFDQDGTLDGCDFAGKAVRFELEPAAGLHLAGHFAWRGIEGTFHYKKRRGAASEVRWQVWSWAETALSAHADVDLGAHEATTPLLNLSVPIAAVPVGPTAITLYAALGVDLHTEGSASAGLGVGVIRQDQWTLDLAWTAAEGLQLSGSHDVDTSPLTEPRLATTAAASLRASLEASLRIVASEGFSQSELSAGLAASAWLGLDVDPSLTPWWQVRAGADAAIEAELELLVGLIDVWQGEVPLTSTDHPLSAAAADEPVAARGVDTRWLRTVDFATGGVNTNTFADLVATQDGGWVGVGNDSLHTYVLRLAADGAPLWAHKAEFLNGTRCITELPDGSVAVAGNDGDRVFLLSPTGDLLWDRAITGEGLTISSCAVVPTVDALGATGLAVATTRQIGSLRSPSVTWLDLTGAVLAMRTYPAAESSSVENAILLSDGHLLLVGATDVDAAPPAPGYSTPAGGGLLLELDLHREPVWATSVNVGLIEGVAELPSGQLVAAADVGTYVYQPRHGLGLLSFNRSGDLLWAATYAEDVRFEGRVDNALDRTPGDTAWDEAADLCVLAGGDVLLVGTSSLGADRAAWALRTTADGEPVWFRLHDGADEDQVRAIACASTGALFGGFTKSFPGEQDSQQAWLARTPLDGGLRHDPAWGWSDRSLQVDVNDLQDLVHVLWHPTGGVDVPISASNTSYTVDDTPSRPPAPTAAVASTLRGW